MQGRGEMVVCQASFLQLTCRRKLPKAPDARGGFGELVRGANWVISQQGTKSAVKNARAMGAVNWNTQRQPFQTTLGALSLGEDPGEQLLMEEREPAVF